MRRNWQLAWGLVAALFVGTASGEDRKAAAPTLEMHDSTGYIPVPTTMPHVGSVQNGYDPYREYPSRGYPGHAASEHPNYNLPNKHYDIWYRPKAFSWPKSLRCEKPLPWLPRGFGNLWHDPVAPDRMDYHRYVVKHPRSGYGPSYYYRNADQRCGWCVSGCPKCCLDCCDDEGATE